jgi:hypothetical protein
MQIVRPTAIAAARCCFPLLIERQVSPHATGRHHMPKSWVQSPYPRKMYARCSYPDMKMLDRKGLAQAAPTDAQGLREIMRAEKYTHIGHSPRSRYVDHATAAAGEMIGETRPNSTDAKAW